MPRLKHNSGGAALTYEFNVQCTGKLPMDIQLIAYDETKPHTVFMDRFRVISSKEPVRLICRMPLSPQVTTFDIVNHGTNNDNGIKPLDKKVSPVKTNLKAFPYWDKKVSRFVKFAKYFCMRAGYLSEGTYVSDEKDFVIFYNKQIQNLDNGAIMNTPARIDANTGQIEVSQQKFRELTIAGRMAILLHEFCHVYQNSNKRDEEEADRRAAMIYLGLGFPRVEILNVFAEVFYKATNDLNIQRYETLKKIVNDFDGNKKILNFV